MSKIQINDLNMEEAVVELSILDSELIVGGNWFKKVTGISTPSFLKKLDDVVHDNGGWPKVIGTAYKLYSGSLGA
jgi:hypothetical protein